MTELASYERLLADCRFCPMCKPAAEVANVVKIEGYSTRSRAMMLWRIAAGQRQWTPRATELLYRSTLDGISEAFCVSDRPVSGYSLAARRDVWAAGLAPHPVRSAVERLATAPQVGAAGERVLLAAEAAEGGTADRAAAVADALGLDLLAVSVGATAFALGADDVARRQVEAATRALAAASYVVTDGPQTLWALQTAWPELGTALDAEVVSLAAHVIAERQDTDQQLGDCYLADSRAAAYLAEQLALPVAIQPGYLGTPDESGRGAVYDDLRAAIRRLGGIEQRHRWERSLARSTGADDGLWATYPELARGLAEAYLERARADEATTIVTDSVLAAQQLEALGADAIAVRWLGDLVAAS